MTVEEYEDKDKTTQDQQQNEYVESREFKRNRAFNASHENDCLKDHKNNKNFFTHIQAYPVTDSDQRAKNEKWKQKIDNDLLNSESKKTIPLGEAAKEESHDNYTQVSKINCLGAGNQEGDLEDESLLQKMPKISTTQKDSDCPPGEQEHEDAEELDPMHHDELGFKCENNSFKLSVGIITEGKQQFITDIIFRLISDANNEQHELVLARDEPPTGSPERVDQAKKEKQESQLGNPEKDAEWTEKQESQEALIVRMGDCVIAFEGLMRKYILQLRLTTNGIKTAVENSTPPSPIRVCSVSTRSHQIQKVCLSLRRPILPGRRCFNINPVLFLGNSLFCLRKKRQFSSKASLDFPSCRHDFSDITLIASCGTGCSFVLRRFVLNERHLPHESAFYSPNCGQSMLKNLRPTSVLEMAIKCDMPTLHLHYSVTPCFTHLFSDVKCGERVIKSHLQSKDDEVFKKRQISFVQDKIGGVGFFAITFEEEGLAEAITAFQLIVAQASVRQKFPDYPHTVPKNPQCITNGSSFFVNQISHEEKEVIIGQYRTREKREVFIPVVLLIPRRDDLVNASNIENDDDNFVNSGEKEVEKFKDKNDLGSVDPTAEMEDGKQENDRNSANEFVNNGEEEVPRRADDHKLDKREELQSEVDEIIQPKKPPNTEVTNTGLSDDVLPKWAELEIFSHQQTQVGRREEEIPAERGSSPNEKAFDAGIFASDPKKASTTKNIRSGKRTSKNSELHAEIRTLETFLRKNFHKDESDQFLDLLEVSEPTVLETILTDQINKLPPPSRMNDESTRCLTFAGIRDLKFSAVRFSKAGFYVVQGNMIQCYSCKIELPVGVIEDVGPEDMKWHRLGCHLAVNTRSRNLRFIESDGRVSDDVGDPPGQQSIYIPPGDVRREAYRLSTFEHYPVACPISRKSLAKSGFYFTGFFDRVKCFACGRTVERWEAQDDPTELKWHKNSCPLPRGEDCGNVLLPSIFQAAPRPSGNQEQVLEQRDPNTGNVIRTVRYPADLPERIRQSGGTFEIGPGNAVTIQSGPGQNHTTHITHGSLPTVTTRRWRMASVISADHKRFLVNLYLNRELDRLTSFARWPVGRPNISPAFLAKHGFFYLGDMDRTQCFSCGGVLRNWTVEDDAYEEHATHFPHCNVVLRTEPRNVPIPDNPETEEEREMHYPCRFPANPHMRSEASRANTFDSRWPAGRTSATTAEIAQAGFFFLGERDRVKCWYCNGGLQNWEYDDVPWVEHAKWFPNCQFLLRVKGQRFVHQHLSRDPHLARPIIAKQDGSTIDPPAARQGSSSSGQSSRSQDIPPNEPRMRQPTPPPTIIDPREEMRKRKERVQNIMKNSEIVKNVLAMGFSESTVAILLEDRIESGNEANSEDVYGTVTELLDDVMKREEELKKEEEERNNQAAGAGSSHSSMPSSVYSAMSSTMSSLGSGKYNVSYFGYDDDEAMDEDMYGSVAGPSASITSLTAAKELGAAGETSKSLKEALNKIEEERMCKICFSEPANMVFVPCSHMCCCMECTQAIRQCPVCRTKIERAIKTYTN